MTETEIIETWEKVKELVDSTGYSLERKDGMFLVSRAWSEIHQFKTVEGVYGYLLAVDERE